MTLNSRLAKIEAQLGEYPWEACAALERLAFVTSPKKLDAWVSHRDSLIAQCTCGQAQRYRHVRVIVQNLSRGPRDAESTR
jgi:hypothetical protein